VEAFTGRLLAIDRAQSLLTGGGHQGVKINTLIREQAIIDKGLEGRFSLSGPELLLDPQLSLNLGLVFHELATNARKYGALSGPLGKVSVGWHVDERGGNRFLKLQWRESGGPKVVPPHSRGFGTVLIDRVARSSADADAGLIYPEDGILCTISVPMQRRAA
jgi:two-component sensor histidine kinase